MLGLSIESKLLLNKVKKLKYKGVVYDIGLRFTEGSPYSVDPFNPALVEYDINTISKKLNANTIRIEGEDVERLTTAARIADHAGLTVFFNPWKMNIPVEELSDYFCSAAKKAELLRQEGANIIFVCGCEITLFNEGIFPGKSIMDRVGWLANLSKNTATLLAEKSAMLNNVLRNITIAVRSEFFGAVTYSSGTWESVNWDMFDIVGVDFYRSGETPEDYVSGLDRYKLNKPLIVMEVGCCTYKGAAARGAGGFMLLEGINPDGTGKFVNGSMPVRDENEQADYISNQLDILTKAGVDGIFIYVFSFPSYGFGVGAKDLDMMSFSLVKTYPKSDPRSAGMPPWSPKNSFYSVAKFFKEIK